MRLFVRSPAARRATLLTLCQVPEPVRRYALEHVVFAGVGDMVGGMAIGPRLLKGAEWVVPLFQRDEVGGTVAHELGHVMVGDREPSAQNEIDAATMARAWGFSGDAADPEGCAARYNSSQLEVAVRVSVLGNPLTCVCACGAQCRIIAPTVPGLPAEVGVECERCGWVKLRSMAELYACQACGTRASVTWAEGASPEHPRATWTCECGESVTLDLNCSPPARVEPSEIPDLSPEDSLLAASAEVIMGLEESLRRMAVDGSQQNVLSLESCRASIAFSRDRVSRAAGVLAGGPREAVLLDLANELTLAAAEFQHRSFADAADRLARVAGELNAMLVAGQAEAERSA